MSKGAPKPVDFIIGPFGERLTKDNLPPSPPRRWVARRKVEMAAAVLGGLITRDEIEQRYGVGEGELADWIAALKRLGG